MITMIKIMKISIAPKFPHAPLILLSCPSPQFFIPRQLLICFKPKQFSLHFLEFSINEIIHSFITLLIMYSFITGLFHLV